MEWTEWHEANRSKIELLAGVDCWIWTKAVDGSGYGVIKRDGGQRRTHREAYIAAYGEIQPGLLVRHLCGCACCVRPSHLRVGTYSENARDTAVMFNTVSSLTIENVRSLRRDYADGVPMRKLVETYGIVKQTVRRIVAYQHFAHVDPELRNTIPRRGVKN